MCMVGQGEDYFTHEFPPAYKGATACRGIDFNDNVGENLTAVGPESPLIGVYSLDIFTARVSRIIHAHAALTISTSSANNKNEKKNDSTSDDQTAGDGDDDDATATAVGLPQSPAATDGASADGVAPPLFLYVAWQNCHDPYDVPQKYIDLYPDVMDLERRNMSAMITALDAGIGATVDDLNSSRLWGRTLMTVHTDNGGELPYASGGEPGVPNENGGAGNNYPLKGGKFSLWEGGIRGRAWITGGLLPPAHRGQVYNGLVSVVDWLPTYAALGGVTNATALAGIAAGPRPLDGFDFTEVFFSSSSSSSSSSDLATIATNSPPRTGQLVPTYKNDIIPLPFVLSHRMIMIEEWRRFATASSRTV